MEGAFHEGTFGAMAVTKSKTFYADGSSPLMVRPLSLSLRQRCLTRGCNRDIAAKRGHPAIPVLASLQLRTGPGRRRALARIDVPAELQLLQLGAPSVTAAAIAEPVFGEGGTPPAFLQGPHEICDKNGLLLIVDGSQSQFEQMFNIGYNQIS